MCRIRNRIIIFSFHALELLFGNTDLYFENLFLYAYIDYGKLKSTFRIARIYTDYIAISSVGISKLYRSSVISTKSLDETQKVW